MPEIPLQRESAQAEGGSQMTVRSMRSVVPGNQITFTTAVIAHIIVHNKVDTLLQLHFLSKLQRSEFQGESTEEYTDPFILLHILYYSLLVGLQNVSKDSVEVGSIWVKCTFGVKTFHPEMCNVLILSLPYFTRTIQTPLCTHVPLTSFHFHLSPLEFFYFQKTV